MSLKGYDGVGWESDVVAYRIYWNADNAMDIFGKTRPILSLDGWATPGVPHQIENQYGLDVLKVGRPSGRRLRRVIDGRIQKISNVMKEYHIARTARCVRCRSGIRLLAAGRASVRSAQGAGEEHHP